MKNFTIAFSVIFYFFLSFSAFSKQSSLQDYQNNQHDEQQLSEAEFAQMLAPIALYPDSLLTHILIASTYPIEIIEAHRWLMKNDELNSVEISQSIESFTWDASVKALVPFEQILSRLSENLTWMQQLGDAFLQDETRVLESIQTLRKHAREAGNLDKMENTQVIYEDNNIIIEPVKKEIVYVPYYDTRMVYGHWYWTSYPPVYWRPHHYSYVSRYNPFYWHTGVHISFNYFFSTFHWHKRHIVVVNPFKAHHYRSRRSISRGGYAKRWAHQPAHRRGVAYKSKVTRDKYYNNKVSRGSARKPTHHVQRQFKQRLSNNKYLSHHKALSTVRRNKNNTNTKVQAKRSNQSTQVKHKSAKHRSQSKQISQSAITKSTKNTRSVRVNAQGKNNTPKLAKNNRSKHLSKQPSVKQSKMSNSKNRASNIRKSKGQSYKNASSRKHRSSSAKSRD